MAKYIVAVSGGIDSVALLHMLQGLGQHELIVAHVDHGIREDSHEDARFVEALARQYNLPVYTKRLELGPMASEERARNARYAFLRELAEKHDAAIVTAHHADDVVETVAINVHRGTGWRGLATHDAEVVRPLLAHTKGQLRAYVHHHNLEWREDSTNRSERYLRNRIRRHVATMDPAKKKEIIALREEQKALKGLVQTEVESLVGVGPLYDRAFFINIPKVAALECLRHMTKARLTRPQLERILLAIKTAQPRTTHHGGSGVELHVNARNFSLSLIE